MSNFYLYECLSACIFVCHVCLVLVGSRLGHWIQWNWSYRLWWATRESWESNMGPLKVKAVLLYAKPSFLLHYLPFEWTHWKLQGPGLTYSKFWKTIAASPDKHSEIWNYLWTLMQRQWVTFMPILINSQVAILHHRYHQNQEFPLRLENQKTDRKAKLRGSCISPFSSFPCLLIFPLLTKI